MAVVACIAVVGPVMAGTVETVGMTGAVVEVRAAIVPESLWINSSSDLITRS